MASVRRVLSEKGYATILIPVWLSALLFGLGSRVAVAVEFQVNTYTTFFQAYPAVADTAGGFVVVWESAGSAGTDSSYTSVQGQRYDTSGMPVGAEFQVNTYTTSFQHRPAVGRSGAGGFVVVWASMGSAGTDVDLSSIQARRYDASGVPTGAEFQVNTYTTSEQFRSAVWGDGAGGFLVVWESIGSAGTDSDYYSVQGQRYDASGAPVGTEFQVNTYTTNAQLNPAVAGDGAGGSVVVWESVGTPITDYSVKGQRYDASGVPVGAEFQVNTYTTDAQQSPAVADAAGGFVVVWQSRGSAGTDTDLLSIQGQRYDTSGLPVGGEFQVNTVTVSDQRRPAVASDGAGGFVVAWESWSSAGTDTHPMSVQLQRYDASGLPVDVETQANSFTTFNQYDPAVASDGAGGFVIVWESEGSFGTDSSSRSVQAVRSATLQTTTSIMTTTTTTTTLPLLILGKKLDVKGSTGDEASRRVLILAKESATDIASTLTGNPTLNGATLRIVTNGMTSSDQTYVLDDGGWVQSAQPGRLFRYRGPTGADDDPVKLVVIKRTPSGTALLKVLVRGNVGSQSLDVVPPDGGTTGGAILHVNSAGMASPAADYCVSFGGAAGGTVSADDPERWRVLDPTAEAGCPSP